MEEARAWTIARALPCTSNLCRLCEKHNETVNPLSAGCAMLESNEFLTRYDRALLILVVEWVKAKEFMEKESFYDKEKWNKVK